MNLSNDELLKKWGPILEHESFDAIADSHKRNVTATILENTVIAVKEGNSFSPASLLTETPANAAGTGGFGAGAAAAGPVAGYDPVLISLVRRSMPNLIAYDICGVQPMTAPTGLIFAMRSKYSAMSGNTSTEAFYNEADTTFSGAGTQTADLGDGSAANTGVGMATAVGEALGSIPGTNDFPEMAFSIEKIAVEAQTRALKAEYTTELAQDLRAVHGLDAETELANILSSEILAEINREVVRTVYRTAVAGSQDGTATAGTFDLDVDANGRWSVEKFKGLMYQIEREANAIAKATRRGKGNIIICSSDVAAALQMAGLLSYTPALNSNNLQVDDTGNTFAGVLNGRYRVYIDPYSGGNYLVVGYKGASAFDAGLFYCPYVPLQMMRAVGENSFQPKLGFKTRYGMVANPFAGGATQGLGALTVNSNVYYRRTSVQNLL
jgi:hypothetical protein